MAVSEFEVGMGELERARAVRANAGQLRRKAGRPLSGAVGVFYGLGAYGSPLGAITGVQVPAPAPVEQPLQEGQFGGEAAGSDGGTQ